MGPRYLQSQIHANYSTGSSVWSDYRSQIKSIYDSSTSKVDFNDHLIREYNRKIERLNQSTNLYISPFDGGFRFIGDSIGSLAPATLTSGLFAFWELDEPSGTRYDSHGSYDLIEINSVNSETGVIGGAGDFYFDWLLSNTTFDLASSGFSVSTWLNGNATNVGPAVAQWQQGYGFIIGIDSAYFGNNEITFILGDFAVNYGVKYPNSSGWHHVVATYDPTIGTSKLYVDGILRDTLTGIPSIPLNGSATFKMGTIDFDGEFTYDGLIDSTALWLRPLNEEEAIAMYNNGNGLPYNQF